MQYLLGLTVWFAPTYVVRFSLFGLPANLLMVWLFFLWFSFGAWLIIGKRVRPFLLWIRAESVSSNFLHIAIFFLAGAISLFVGGISQEKLGQFIVLFVQPIGTYFIFRYLLSVDTITTRARRWFLWSCLYFVAAAGLYAILQYITLLGVPQAWWGNSQEPKRAVAFFLHPNFYALFVTPVLAFLVPLVGESMYVRHSEPAPGEESRPLTPSKVLGFRMTNAGIVIMVAWTIGAIGLLLSLSRGGWLGLAAAASIYVLIAGNRTMVRTALAAALVAVLVVAVVPNFRYRVLLPFRGEKSSVARLSLWHTGWKMITDSPVAGKGLLGFSNNWYAYNTDTGLEHYPAPHNIFLNFWVDTGLLGLISFFGLVVFAVFKGVTDRKNIHKLGLALACMALVVHGLIDIPYFKNDLALLFWMLYAFI